MIKTEEIEINGIKFMKTYSDSNHYISRDNAKYSEAIDPIEFSDRVYIELDEVIEDTENEVTSLEFEDRRLQ